MQDESLVLVTGASTGIGRAIALELDRRGYRVIAGVRRDEDGVALRNEGSPRLCHLRLDVTDGGQIQNAANAVARASGGRGLAALINNAGYNLTGPFEYTSEESARAVMEVNFFGLHRLSQAMIPSLRLFADVSGSTSKLVNLGSIGSTVGFPWEAFYHASKFAVLGLSESMRHELYDQGIRVCAVLPGGVKTPFIEKSGALLRTSIDALAEGAPPNYSSGLRRLLEVMSMSDRFGSKPEAVARRIALVLESANPRLRHFVGRDAAAMRMLRRLPDAVHERLIRHAMAP